jgi:CRP-like cAMP-binding protein
MAQVNKKVLKKLPQISKGILTGVPEKELGELVLREKTFKEGKVICRTGQKANSVFVILEGKADIIVRLPTKDMLTVMVAKRGDIVGEMGIFLKTRKRTADIVAITECKTLVWDAYDFLRILHKYPGIAVNMLNIMSERVDKMNKKIVSFLYKSI